MKLTHDSLNVWKQLRKTVTLKKRKFGTICTTFTSCTNRSTQFGTTSHSLICIRLRFSLFTRNCQLHITLLSKHNTQCSVVAHTSQVKSQSINLQHTNSQISKHSGRLSNLQWGLQHKSALSLCFVWWAMENVAFVTDVYRLEYLLGRRRKKQWVALHGQRLIES